tara:strand:+ start:887 stop:2326 length:1440 start_codon:yes stop_codon:yes gene_type:complete
LLAISCLLTISIFFIRFGNSISFSHITHVLTSGYEEESLLEIWYNLKGESSYINHLSFPYRWKVYNWLFYDFYSLIYIVLNFIFNLKLDWLPTILRLLTLASSCLLLYLVLITNKILNNNSKFNFFLSTSLIFGLSFGYWNITVRPDIISILFEITALFIFLKLKRNPSNLNLIIIGLVLFIAWSFKQTALIVFCTINAYLLLNFKIKKNIILVTTCLSLVFLTIFLQSSDYYISTLYFLNTEYNFQIDILFYNSAKLVSKNLILFSALIMIFYLKLNKINRSLEELKKYISSNDSFLSIGLIISILYFLAINTNAGASDNHSFILIIFLNFLVINNQRKILTNSTLKKVLIFSIISYIFICISIISGNLGRLSPNKYLNINEYKQCIENTSQSKYIDKNYYRLPWITNYSNPSVETFNYKYELKNNNLEHGGHEGLINNGFYEYLILFNEKKYNLSKYSLDKKCNNLKIYKLKSNSSD